MMILIFYVMSLFRISWLVVILEMFGHCVTFSLHYLCVEEAWKCVL